MSTHVNLVHDGGEFRVLGVLHVNDGPRVLEVLDVLGVHLEEVGKLDHDVPDLLVLEIDVPFVHSFT